MKSTPAKLLDVVAVLEEKPAYVLVAGQVGTILEVLAPDVFEVEFCDPDGHAICLAELRRDEILVLRQEPASVA